MNDNINDNFNNDLNNNDIQINNINSIENKDFSNGVNNLMKDKKKLILVAVILGCLVFVILLFFLLKNSVLFTSNVISEEELKKYNIETETIWINKPLGITYEVPKQIDDLIINRFTYMHGSVSDYYSGREMYVEKSLEGSTNLKTLASDIIREKTSDKYSFVYKFGRKGLKPFDIALNENVKIGKFDTVYFESVPTEYDRDDDVIIMEKYLGYSFKYNDEYISVYARYVMDGKCSEEELKIRLKYLISSIQDYNGKSLQELGGNAKNFFDDGFSNLSHKSQAKTPITINNYSSHILNGILRTSWDTYGRDRFCFELFPDEISFKNGNLDELTDAIKNSTLSQHSFLWFIEDYKTNSFVTNYDIIKEDTLTLNGINIKKYIIKTYYINENSVNDILCIYIFEVDGQAYVCQYKLDDGIYNDGDLKYTTFSKLPIDKQNVVINQTEAVADSMILTFRILDKKVALMDEKQRKEENLKYIEMYGGF